MTLEKEGTTGSCTLGSVWVVDGGTIGSGVGRWIRHWRWDCETERLKKIIMLEPPKYEGPI